MKIISNDTKNSFKRMFDTDSVQIREMRRIPGDEYYLSHDMNNTATAFYLGTQSQVREMFDAIVAAEKRGDKFFEIEY